jgi:amidase
MPASAPESAASDAGSGCGLPAVSVPAGFHATQPWPMGLQLMGAPQGDAELLKVAAAYEAISTSLLHKRPQ